MKFLTDQDVYAKTVRFLKELGHDVITASEIDMSRADDSDLLRTAHDKNRIFITRDRDFGGLVFIEKLGSGVIYLRILPSTMDLIHQELKRVLNEYSEEKLHSAFVVVEAGRYRYRKVDGITTP